MAVLLTTVRAAGVLGDQNLATLQTQSRALSGPEIGSITNLAATMPDAADAGFITQLIFKLNAVNEVQGAGSVTGSRILYTAPSGSVSAIPDDGAFPLGSVPDGGSWRQKAAATKPGGGAWTWTDVNGLTNVGVATDYEGFGGDLVASYLAEIAVEVWGDKPTIVPIELTLGGSAAVGVAVGGPEPLGVAVGGAESVGVSMGGQSGISVSIGGKTAIEIKEA